MEVTEQFWGVSAFLLLCGSWSFTSDHQAWWQRLLPAEPSSRPPWDTCSSDCMVPGAFAFQEPAVDVNLPEWQDTISWSGTPVQQPLPTVSIQCDTCCGSEVESQQLDRPSALSLGRTQRPMEILKSCGPGRTRSCEIITLYSFLLLPEYSSRNCGSLLSNLCGDRVSRQAQNSLCSQGWSQILHLPSSASWAEGSLDCTTTLSRRLKTFLLGTHYTKDSSRYGTESRDSWGWLCLLSRAHRARLISLGLLLKSSWI